MDKNDKNFNENKILNQGIVNIENKEKYVFRQNRFNNNFSYNPGPGPGNPGFYPGNPGPYNGNNTPGFYNISFGYCNQRENNENRK